MRNGRRLDPFRSDRGEVDGVALQLGGNDPIEMAQAAVIGHNAGYSHININAGCPSPKVAGSGYFGAALMLQPSLLVDIAASIREATGGAAPSVKCRIVCCNFY